MSAMGLGHRTSQKFPGDKRVVTPPSPASPPVPLNPRNDSTVKSSSFDTDNVLDLKSSLKPTQKNKTSTTASNVVIPVHIPTSPLNPSSSIQDSDTFSSAENTVKFQSDLLKSPPSTVVSQKILLPPLPTSTSKSTPPSNTSPRLNPFTLKVSSPIGSSPPPAVTVNPRLREFVAQAREWKEMYADDAKAFFYYHKTTQENQWEAPSSGYIRVDTRLVLQDGSVIDDPVLKPPTATNDANTMLSQMEAWKSEEENDP